MEQLELFPKKTHQYYNLQHRCNALIVALVGSQMSDKWWGQYNKHFRCTPQQQMQYNPQQVYQYLMKHSDGAYY